MSVETLDVTSAINVVQDSYGSNKYVLNGNTTYNSNTKYSLDVGTYQITGIPTSHPLAIVDISDSNFLTYTGLTANKTIKDGEDYYTGNITIQVTGDFGKASIKCAHHGYMGGQNLLQFVVVTEIHTLNVTSAIDVIQDANGANKYVLNGNTTYSSNIKYSLSLGTYQFTGIPSGHPLAIVDISDSSLLTYSGLETNKTIKDGVDYYSGNITIQVTGDFGTASIKCANHGYMGGQNLLQYVVTEQEVNNVDTNVNTSYVNSSIYSATSSKITKKYYKDFQGNSELFFDERVRIKSNNIFCSNSNKTIEIQHTKNDQLYIVGSKPSSGSYALYQSKDGLFWSPLLTTVFTHVRGIAYLPETEIWVACGSGSNTLAYSIDGKNWTGLGKTIFTDVAYSVAYGNGTWVAVGGNTTNTIAYSLNGITWTGVGNSIFTNCGKAIGYGNGMWIAGGQGTNTMAYSLNGINWTGLGETIFDEQCNVVKHANNMWVAGGGNDIPNTLAYSTDGLNWTGRRYNNIRYYTYGLDYANNMWLAGGGKKDEGYSGGTARNWVLVSDSITNWNGSFEDPVVSSFGPVNDTHNNLEIPGWSWSVPSDANSSALLGPAFGSNPWDGTPIAGSGNQQVGIRLHQSLYKTITGTLKHGSVYQLKLMAITRYGQYDQSRPDPTIKVYYNGTEIYEFTLRMMDGDLPVLIDNILFTASGNNHEIKFEHQHNEDYTMMMDDIQLFEDTYSDLDVSASDLSGITISPSVVGTVLTGTSWALKSSTMNNWNGGFESDVLGINQFVKMGRDDPFNGVLTGWTYTTGKHSAWGPTLLNSNNSGLGNQAIIHGTQMIGLRYNQTLTKTMSDLVVGKDYKLRYQRHARVAQTNIEYRLYLENTSNILKQETVATAASEVEANRLIEIDFTAGAPQQSFTLEQLSGGDNMIWFDKFELYEDQSSGTWDNTGSVSNVEWKEISNTITNWNGSFESDTVSAGSYYIVGSTTNGSNNGPASLTGWTQEAANETYGAVLVNTHSDQMYDNSQYNGGLPSGSIIQGQQAVGLHLGTKLKKTINDLTVGTDYKLSYEVFKFDKSQGQVYYNVQLDSESTLLKLTTEITNGETSLRSIRTHTVTFKATQTSHTIIFAAASGLTWNMFFLDNVKLYERKTGQAVVFGQVSEIPSGSIGLETADDNAFNNNWTTNYDNTIMLDLDFDTVFASQGLTIALAGSAGPSTNYAPNSGPLKWHYNLDSVTGGLQSNQTLIPGIYNATYDLTLPNSTYTKALGIGAYGNTGVIVSKTFSIDSTVRVVYGYGRIDSTTGADLGGSGVGSSATIKVSGVQKDTTTEAQKTVTFDVNSGETMEIVGSLLLYAIEFFPKLYAATNTFILTGPSKSLTDINNSSIALELVGSPNFTAENGVELTGETSKYIKIPQSIMNFGAGDFSVSLWIKDAVYTSSPSTASGGWAYGGTLLSMDFNAHINSTGGFVLTTALAENDRRVYVHDQISTAKTATSSFNYGDDSGLHNYVITRKGNTIRLFIDNVEEVSYDHAPPANYPNADDTNYIGLMLWSNSPSRPLKGNITKFEVWGDAGFDTWPPPAPDTPSGDSGSGSGDSGSGSGDSGSGSGDSGSGTTDPNAPTNSFILTGASKSLTDVNNAGVSLELFGSPTFSETNGVQLTSSTSNYIKIPQSIMNFGADDFSLSIWMKNINYVSTHDTIFNLNWNHPGTSSGYMFFGLGGSNTNLRIIDKFLSRSSMLYNDYTQLNWGSDNDLHNYVVSRKGTTMRVFEDNVEVISHDIGTYSYPNTNDENLIGVSLWSNSPSYPMEADITKFEIWNGTGYETWPPPVTSDDSGSDSPTTTTTTYNFWDHGLSTDYPGSPSTNLPDQWAAQFPIISSYVLNIWNYRNEGETIPGVTSVHSTQQALIDSNYPNAVGLANYPHGTDTGFVEFTFTETASCKLVYGNSGWYQSNGSLMYSSEYTVVYKNGTQIDSTQAIQKIITFDVVSGDVIKVWENSSSILLYVLEVTTTSSGDTSGATSSNTLTATEWNAQYGSTVFNTVNSGYLDDSALFAAVTANNIKVIVQSWNSYLAMNWGVYVDGVLENPSFANRENSSYFTGDNAYNYEDSTLDSGNSWVAGSNSVGQWTMIKYSTPQTFTGVKITPRQSGYYTSMYISSFKLEFS
tara:strand:- start:2636 stop:9103 length:6468 start_codon:yes stop_codon:yes gene_type:complete